MPEIPQDPSKFSITASITSPNLSQIQSVSNREIEREKKVFLVDYNSFDLPSGCEILRPNHLRDK